MEEINKLNLEELKELRNKLNLYRSLDKQLGDRGNALFKREINNENLLLVEYFDSISEEFAFEKASEVYSKVFNITPKKEDVVFEKKASLSGGIKVYKDDSMVDVSFSKVEAYMNS